ncbi:MAG: M12 family metallo-peptidase [Planctomycetota bacterium]
MHPHPFASAAAGLVFLTAPLGAQSVDFPLTDGGRYAGAELPLYRPDLDAIRALTARDDVRMSGVPLPGGAAVELELTRIAIEDIEFGFRVDGVARPDLLDGLDLTVWKGRVAGDSSSEALVSFSRAGTRGWIRTAGTLAHLLPQPDETGAWELGYSILASEEDLRRLGESFEFECGTESVAELGRDELDGIPSGGSGGAPGFLAASTIELYGCDIAVETDYQLNQVFGGSLSAETAYMTTLLGAISDRYAEQHRTQLNYPYLQFYTTSSDPWSTPDVSGSTSAMLDEFVAAWQGNLPVPADLGHFISGASLGGGIAYVSVLCDVGDQFNFGVSANIDGSVAFPVVQGPLNWDFMVIAHELGHNFGSPHTHDYSPPIDTCPSGGCINDGTIMSYCHQCSGGLANITTYFHPLVVDLIAPQVDNCLPLLVGMTTSPPTVVPPDVPTSLTLDVVGSPVGTVDLNYRFDPAASFQVLAMTDAGGGAYTADLPAPACADQPEFFFSMTDATLGLVSTETFAPEVGVMTVSFADTFTGDLGWTAGVAGDDATTGVWERGGPLGTAAQPSAGQDDGFCYFTGQGSSGGSLGEEDVDGGSTTLVSPVIDLSAGSARISYQRWYSNTTGASPGADVFEVEITGDGSTWVDVETVGPGGSEASGGWFYHEFEVADFITPTANVQVRFIASDLGSGSIVEAAVDAFQVFTTTCADPAPVAAFGASVASGEAPLSVDFTDLSSGTVDTWTWTFGDGGTSSLQNPTHDYDLPGTYTVSLTTSGPFGSDVETKLDHIVAAKPPLVGTPYGSTTPGSLGAPTMEAHSNLTPGAAFYMVAGNMPAATTGFLALSVHSKVPAIDLSNGLLLNVNIPLLLLTPAVADANGEAIVKVNIPPSAAGLTVFLQTFNLDGAGADDYASSLGRQVNLP